MKVQEIKNNPTLWDYGFQEKEHYYWWASWYARILGYKGLKTLKPSIQKAKKICVQLGIPFEDNFIRTEGPDGDDIKLTKFACFLIALQADGRKPIVKRARTYFLNELEDLNVFLSGQDYLNRMIGREELKHLNQKLNKAAKRAQVKDFRFFMNEGYLGMYNKTANELKLDRGISVQKSLSDYMSMTELAANIFRITLTAERLKYIKNPTQQKAARQHWKIGSQIRSMIKDNTGSYPENLPLATDLNFLRKKLRDTQKILNREVGLPEGKK